MLNLYAKVEAPAALHMWLVPSDAAEQCSIFIRRCACAWRSAAEQCSIFIRRCACAWRSIHTPNVCVLAATHCAQSWPARGHGHTCVLGLYYLTRLELASVGRGLTHPSTHTAPPPSIHRALSNNII
jgi:hypothetical protein